MERMPGSEEEPKGLTRRQLLVGGGAGAGLLLAWGLWTRSYAPNLKAAQGEHVMGALLKIAEDGQGIVIEPQAELGPGGYTVLPQLVADELGADWRKVSVQHDPIH